ncbi:FHA domain-containing protein [Catenulispora pinisilvae]|uniref:FHA domain-containing protein n=1 Tax=Catenulispora pinisilvae TaxID=2705253 RepID=UPI001E337800|nr:FHA domain-containing protein [Catenulispora pinisilvae]
MMATCPDGHQTVATDYCDECGLSMGGPVQVSEPVSSAGTGGAASAYGSPGDPCPNCLIPRQAGDTFCEACGFPFDQEGSIGTGVWPGPGAGGTTGTDPVGGGDPVPGPGPVGGDPTPGPLEVDPVFVDPVTIDPVDPVGAPAATSGWIAVASADRAYYDAVVAEGEIDAAAYPFPPYCPEREFALDGDTVRIGRSGKKGSVEIDLTGPPTDPGISHLHAVLQRRPDGGWSVVDLESTNGTVLNDDTAPLPPNQAFPVEAGQRVHVGVWTTLTLIQRS